MLKSCMKNCPSKHHEALRFHFAGVYYILKLSLITVTMRLITFKRNY